MRSILLWLIGPVSEVFGYWQIGALHKIESEDVVTALLKYSSSATGVIAGKPRAPRHFPSPSEMDVRLFYSSPKLWKVSISVVG